MSQINVDIKNRSMMNYISTAPFNGAFFKYTTSFNPTTFTNTGSLTTVTGATVANCPAGRVLRANGKKLYPPSSTLDAVGPYPGVTTLMVGVYDSISCLTGYIDPNSSMFAYYNVDKSVDTSDSVDMSGNVIHRGMSVFTLGDVVAGRQIRSTASTAFTAITTNGAQTALVLDPTLGQTFTYTISPPSGVASVTITAPSAPVGAVVRLFITATTVQNTTITFGTGFRTTGTLVVTAAAGPATRYFIIQFAGDGTSLSEISRTAALS